LQPQQREFKAKEVLQELLKMQEMYRNKEISTETLGRIEQNSDLSGLSECAKGQGKEDKVPDPRATW
jgi:hypothetical protein